MKDKVQAVITLAVVGTYIYLVVTAKAAIEGFAILAVYVIKKALDLIEQNGGAK